LIVQEAESPCAKTMKTTKILLSALALAAVATPLAAQEKATKPDNIDKRLPRYEKVDLVLKGDLNAVGSDTMINLMTLWGEKFKAYYPGVRVQVEGKGSSTAPPALIQSTAQFGPMSRKMKDKEIDAFIEQFDYEPIPIQVCLDALALFVHKDNPVAETGLTMEQIDAIFSKTRKRGGLDIRRWGQLGLDGLWSQSPISLYGRNSASGTYGYFKKIALAKGDYKETVKEQTGSASVVQSITADKAGIGYSGIGYKTSGVVTVPLSEDGDEFFAANLENVVSGDYPLGRFLNIYINLAPNSEMDPVRREFFRFVFSREGQQVVEKAGYLPINADVAQRELAKIGVEFIEADPTAELEGL
jgi:phosphate transport system substrate-binding protein